MNADASKPAGLGWKPITILGALALASLGIYLLASRLTYRVGFPLDDAWIHQTYAHSLASSGEWSFIPGKPSGGSTSPLWSALLAIGFVLRIGPYIWTYILGWVVLTAIAVAAEHTMRIAIGEYRTHFPWVGLVFVFEWHLAWAAGSGMETLLYGLVIALVLFGILAGEKRWMAFGILSGIAVWIRPDGISLMGPVLLSLWLGSEDLRMRLRSTIAAVGGFLLFFLPYLGFNRMTAGTWWPNTFYAKQAEYAALQQLPLVQRYLGEWLPLVVGVGAVLLPAAVYFVWSELRKRRVGQVIPPVLWLAGILAVYAWRLPVVYQHGRYVMPAMPVLFWVGLAGLVAFLTRSSTGRMGWVLGRTWVLSLGAVLVIFYGIGAQTYAVDVATIESEMVDTARWVAANTPPGSLVAAHDIGALGYFGGRDLVDLAGLISPEVVPFIRDEVQLSAFLDQKQVDYLVVFPNWYQHLADGRKSIFSSNGKFAPRQGQPNMQVYSWRSG
jgi:hypothetical protein